MPVAKVNHMIPCFSIRWKSKGSLLIKCLTLILSWSLIAMTLDKLTLLSLKVTVTIRLINLYMHVRLHLCILVYDGNWYVSN